MEIFFRSSDINNFMDVPLGTEHDMKASVKYYKFRMIEENNIPYMLRPTSYELDGALFLRYSTTGNYILGRMLAKLKIDGVMLRLILAQLCECVYTLEKYLLSANDIVADVRYMTYNPETKNIGVIYVPEYNVDIRFQIKAMLELLMQGFDHRDREGIIYMYGIYDIAATENISMDKLRNAILYGVEYSDEKTACENEIYTSSEGVCLEKGEEEERIRELKEIECRAVCLVPLTNGALDIMNFDSYGDEIVIGRGKKESDYRLFTNQISRVHACIHKRGNRIFLEDKNSTNGTFLNSVKLNAFESIPLNTGDIIAFANEEFFVK